MASPANTSPTRRFVPARTLRGLTAGSLIVANMIGSGVFTTSGYALADMGHPGWVLLAWALGGVLAICGALCYGAIARRYPESGGEYTFLRYTVGPWAGFLAGWISLFAGFTAPIAAAALGMQAYLQDFFGNWLPRPEWIGTGAIAVAWVAHAGGRGGAWLQNSAVALKLLAIAIWVFGGTWQVDLSALAPSTADAIPPLLVWGQTLIWVGFAYSGWNAAVYVGAEVRDPVRTLPRALLGATVLVTLMYCALNGVFLAAGGAALAGRADVAAVAARALGGAPAQRLMAGLVALALFTSISAMMLAGPRVWARMSDDGLLPAALGTGGLTPSLAVAVQALVAIAVVWWSALARVLGYAGWILGVCTALTVLGALRLRLREGPEALPMWGYPWVPLVFVGGVVVTAVLFALRDPVTTGWGMVTVVSGIPVYLWMRAKNDR